MQTLSENWQIKTKNLSFVFANFNENMQILLLLYTDNITDGITIGFKKANRMVTWHFYR